MTSFRLARAAEEHVDGITDYTTERWGDRQAERYTRDLFQEFGRIAARRFPWRPISASSGIRGFRHHWRKHVIYWRLIADGNIVIVAVLHERMDQLPRARRAFDADLRDPDLPDA